MSESMNETRIDVLIPTEGLRARASELRRAITSVQAQQGVDAWPLVILNGTRFDPELRAELEARNDIAFVYFERGHQSDALAKSIAHVQAEYFATLDDDDVFLPHALRTRLGYFLEDPSLDMVATDGYIEQDGKRTPLPRLHRHLLDDLLLHLTYENWLHSCAGLFRTVTVGPEYFENLPRNHNWTVIAMRLTLQLNVRFAGDLTFVYYVGAAGQMTATGSYMMDGPASVAQILALPVPKRVRRRLRKKYRAMLHDCATYELGRGRRLKALICHLRSMGSFYGLRYLLFSRYFLLPRGADGERSGTI